MEYLKDITYIIYYLAAINIITFIVYAADKQKARRGRQRISERTLILLGVAGGSIGALLAMYTIRHKTRHPKFTVGLPIILLAQICLAGYYLFSRN